MPPDWRDADESLIRMGEPILELGFVENHLRDLDSMDRGKEDSTYKLTPPASTSSQPFDASAGCHTASSKCSLEPSTDWRPFSHPATLTQIF